jgi:hypothetical protein
VGWLRNNMQTIIKDEDYELELNNDDVDNLNFINLSIWRNGNCLGEPLDLNIRELMGALIGFDSQRSRMSDFDRECE